MKNSPNKLNYASPGTRLAKRFNVFSRLMLWILMIALPLAGAIAYSGGNAMLMVKMPGDLLLLAAWFVGVYGIGAAAIDFCRVGVSPTAMSLAVDTNGRRHAHPTNADESSENFFSALKFATDAAVGLGIVSLTTLGLGLAGWLNQVTSWAFIAVGIAAALWKLVRRRDRIHAMLNRLWEPMGIDGWFLLAAPLLAIALVVAFTPPWFFWTPSEPHGYDAVEYHLQVPREWFELHRIVPLHHNVFSFVPFNVEMHYLLGMNLAGGPWAGMYLAQLMHLVFFILTVTAVYGIARHWASRFNAMLAACAMLTVPWLTQLAGIAYDEGGFLLFGVLAIGWALAGVFQEEHRIRRLALAGAMAGFSAGAKLTALPEIVAAVPIVITIIAIFGTIWSKHATTRLSRSLCLGLLAYCVAATVTFGPWMARNAVWTGNPVFPELVPILGHGHFDEAQIERWEQSLKPTQAERPMNARLGKLMRDVLLDWQFGYVILPLGIIAAIIARRNAIAWHLAGLFTILILFWLTMTHLQARFFVLAAPLAALMLSLPDWKPLGRRVALVVVIFAMCAGSIRLSAAVSSTLNPGGIMVPVGLPEMKPLTEALLPQQLPDGTTLVLVGEARAFMYQIPTSQLVYRTVFDVPGGVDFNSAWVGTNPPKDAYYLIDPGELTRFSKTYRLMPVPPPALIGDGQRRLSRAIPPSR